ncbi:MAG: hypothetical protein QOJ68_882 [Blastococcus sp.]|jgi:hypothetical protein|nr:hypothetical protein [Blastococcus sp.]
MRRTRALALALLTLPAGGFLAACGSDTTAILAEPLCPSAGRGAGNGAILMAQSVPTATWIPCIRSALPLGWNFHHLDARNGEARFWLDSDRDGQLAVEVRLAASCDTAGATEVASDHEDMRRLERVGRTSPSYAGERYYLYEGGCLTVVFSLDGNNAGEALALASQAIGVVPRDELRAQVHDTSDGRLSLDPPPQGNG